MAGKQKGSRGEREVAALLEKWWTVFEPNAVFVRTPQSGGWANAPGFRARGDVMVGKRKLDGPDPTFPFTVEVKRREAWSYDYLINDRPSPVWKWWAQVCKAAKDDNAEPLLVFRRNRSEWLVLLPESAVDRMHRRVLARPNWDDPSALLSTDREWPDRDGSPVLTGLADVLASQPALWAP